MGGMAWRTFRRDWRAGEVKVLFFALMIAVSAMVAIGVITDRIQGAMAEQAGEFLGADYRFNSPQPIDQTWLEREDASQLTFARSSLFSTVLASDEDFQLVNVRSLTDAYPVNGTIEIADKAFTAGEKLQAMPPSGTMWVEPRILSVLGVEVGDMIDFGETQLQIGGVIVSAPGQVSEVFNVAPNVIINQADVAAANIIQAGSRVNYELLFSGQDPAREDFATWLEENKNPTQGLTGGKDGTPALQSAIERAEIFLQLASLVSVVLAGVAIAVAAGRYSRRHFDYAAIYRCLGMQSKQVHRLYFWQLTMIGVVGAAFGVILGLLIQHLVIMQFSDYLPQPMVPIGFAPVITGALSGLVVLLGFALPAFIQIAQVPPLRVLRKELVPQAMAGYVIYALAIAAMAGLMWWQSRSWILVGAILVVAMIAYLLIRLVAWMIFKLGVWLGKFSPMSVRYGLGQLKRYPKFTISQITAFGIAFIIMLSTVLIRTELLQEWQNQLPKDSPNHFLINVQPSAVDELEGILAQKDVSTAGIYPMVRGRVTALKGVPVEQAMKEQKLNDNALRRELNLTWMTDVPSANEVVEGEWWVGDWLAESSDLPQISIEKPLADRLKVTVGDEVEFSVGGLPVKAVIGNLRSIQWDSFQPNFYVIFQPGTLPASSASHITSFHLKKEDKPLLNTILAAMPTVTIIELDKIMEQVQTILNQVTMAVEFIMFFVVLAGIAVLYAVLQANRDERVLSATLLKTLGAQTPFIRASLLSELALLGLFSGLLGVIGAELLVSTLYREALNVEPVLHYNAWIIMPLASITFIALVGWWGMRGLLKRPAHEVLRQM